MSDDEVVLPSTPKKPKKAVVCPGAPKKASDRLAALEARLDILEGAYISSADFNEWVDTNLYVKQRNDQKVFLPEKAYKQVMFLNIWRQHAEQAASDLVVPEGWKPPAFNPEQKDRGMKRKEVKKEEESA
jgi:hypothetical protein